MRLAVRRLGVVVTFAAVAVGGPGLAKEEPPSPTKAAVAPAKPVSEAEQEALFKKAGAAWNSQAFFTATEDFKRFLRLYPQSPLAPEAAFKIAAAQALEGNTAGAAKGYESLVRDYFDSPWAGLVVATFFDAKQLYNLADEKRKHGREPDGFTDAARAIKLLELYLARFGGPNHPPDAKPKEQILYQLADCWHRRGQEDRFFVILQQLREHDKDGKWGKLAALRLADADAFRAGMDEMIHLEGVEEEALLAFLDLSDQYLPTLKGEDRVKCLYYRAHCFNNVGKKKDGLALYETIVKEHASSRWAADSAMWIAENHFGDGDLAAARAAYQTVVQQFPKSPRAAQAQDCITWMGQLDQSAADLETVLSAMLKRAATLNESLSLRLQTLAPDPKFLNVRLAVQDRQHLLVRIASGPSELVLINNPEGAWYRAPGQDYVLHSRQPLEVPTPRAGIQQDAEGHIDFSWGIGMQSEAGSTPWLTYSPGVAGLMASRMKTWAHLAREVHKDDAGRDCLTFRFHTFPWGQEEPSVWEVKVGGDRMVQEVRFASENAEGKKVLWALSDIAFGGKLPDKLFANPGGVPVREVGQINSFEVMMEAMKLVGAMATRAASEIKK